MRPHVVYQFGAFELDPGTRQLTSGTGPVYLTAPQSALLLLLVTSAPDVVDKDALANAGWGGASVSPNSIEQVISGLRKALNATDDRPFVETVRHRGYRFVEPIRQLERRDVAAGGSDLEAFRAFLHGSQELATLSLDGIRDARRHFEQTIQRVPTDAAAHAALGMRQTRGRLKASLKRALEAVDTLDVTVANTFASDEVTLAEWKRERRRELRRPRPRAVKPAKPAVTLAPAAPAPLEAVAPATTGETVMPEAPAVTDAAATKAA